MSIFVWLYVSWDAIIRVSINFKLNKDKIMKRHQKHAEASVSITPKTRANEILARFSLSEEIKQYINNKAREIMLSEKPYTQEYLDTLFSSEELKRLISAHLANMQTRPDPSTGVPVAAADAAGAAAAGAVSTVPDKSAQIHTQIQHLLFLKLREFSNPSPHGFRVTNKMHFNAYGHSVWGENKVLLFESGMHSTSGARELSPFELSCTDPRYKHDQENGIPDLLHLMYTRMFSYAYGAIVKCISKEQTPCLAISKMLLGAYGNGLTNPQKNELIAAVQLGINHAIMQATEDLTLDKRIDAVIIDPYKWKPVYDASIYDLLKPVLDKIKSAELRNEKAANLAEKSTNTAFASAKQTKLTGVLTEDAALTRFLSSSVSAYPIGITPISTIKKAINNRDHTIHLIPHAQHTIGGFLEEANTKKTGKTICGITCSNITNPGCLAFVGDRGTADEAWIRSVPSGINLDPDDSEFNRQKCENICDMILRLQNEAPTKSTTKEYQCIVKKFPGSSDPVPVPFSYDRKSHSKLSAVLGYKGGGRNVVTSLAHRGMIFKSSHASNSTRLSHIHSLELWRILELAGRNVGPYKTWARTPSVPRKLTQEELSTLQRNLRDVNPKLADMLLDKILRQQLETKNRRAKNPFKLQRDDVLYKGNDLVKNGDIKKREFNHIVHSKDDTFKETASRLLQTNLLIFVKSMGHLNPDVDAKQGNDVVRFVVSINDIIEQIKQETSLSTPAAGGGASDGAAAAVATGTATSPRAELILESLDRAITAGEKLLTQPRVDFSQRGSTGNRIDPAMAALRFLKVLKTKELEGPSPSKPSHLKPEYKDDNALLAHMDYYSTPHTKEGMRAVMACASDQDKSSAANYDLTTASFLWKCSFYLPKRCTGNKKHFIKEFLVAYNRISGKSVHNSLKRSCTTEKFLTKLYDNATKPGGSHTGRALMAVLEPKGKHTKKLKAARDLKNKCATCQDFIGIVSEYETRTLETDAAAAAADAAAAAATSTFGPSAP